MTPDALLKRATITVTLVVSFYETEDPIDVMTKDITSGEGWEGTGKRLEEVIEPHVDAIEDAPRAQTEPV